MSTSGYPDRNLLEIEYRRTFPLYQSILEDFVRRVEKAVSSKGVSSSVKFRVKSFSSYYKKLLRKMTEASEAHALPVVNDIMGIRIVCPFIEDLKQVRETLLDYCMLREEEQKGAEYSFKEFGYQSIHLLVELPDDLKNRFQMQENSATGTMVCEVQIRTILQDAWSEVEHELVYKVDFTPYDEPLRRKLAALNANLSLSDIIFQEIRDYQRRLHGELEMRRISFIRRVEAEEPDAVSGGGLSAPETVRPAEDRQTGGVTSGTVDELLLEALNAHNNEEFHRAIDLYDTIIRREIASSIKAIIYVHRGMALFSAAQYDEALDDFLESSKLDTDNSKAYYYQGIVYRVLDKPIEALEAFRKSLEINPYNFESLFAAAQAYFKAGDAPAALEYCSKALALEPESHKVIDFRRYVSESMKL